MLNIYTIQGGYKTLSSNTCNIWFQWDNGQVYYFQLSVSLVLCMIGPNRRARRYTARSGPRWHNRLPVQLVLRTRKKRGSELRKVYHDFGRSGIIACRTAAYITHRWKAAPAFLTWTSNPWPLIRLKFLIFLFLLHEGAKLVLFYIFIIRRQRVL
jgi:hypothetical protein